ncbi:MAG: DUF5667 domain-containing protein [Minisyncoccia bacterium]
MKKLLILGVVLMSVPVVSFAQTGTTTGTQATGTAPVVVTDPGLLPGDFFYFFDKWSESLSLALTFNNEKKARKHLEYAKERISEMSKVLENPTAKLEDVAGARDDFDKRITKAVSILKTEKDKGVDVSSLAREIDDELDDIKDDLEEMLKDHEYKFSNAEAEIRAKLDSLSPADPQFKGLTQALESITKEKHDIANELDDLDIDLDDEQALFEEIMGKELLAEKHMEQDEKRALKNTLDIGDMQMDGTDEDRMDIDDIDVNDLEDTIKKGERMMEEFMGGEPSNGTNNINR